MKRITLLLMIAALFTSCFDEDTDDCPADSYPLYFSYKGDIDTDIFQSKIESVNLYIYNLDNTLVKSMLVAKSDLALFQGAYLNLPVGKYNIVCWGNITALSSVKQENNSQSAELAHPNYYTATNIESNDSLYYGNYTIDILPKSEKKDTVHFIGSHIKFKINIYRTNNTTNYIVRVNNLLPTYNFAMQSLQNPISYYPTTTDNSTYRFNILRIKDDNAVTIDIVDPLSNNIIYTLSLKDYMIQYGISVENKNEASITVNFSATNIGIIVLPWNGENLYPEM